MRTRLRSIELRPGAGGWSLSDFHGALAAAGLLTCGLLLQACTLSRSAPLLNEVQSAGDHNLISLSPVTLAVTAATRSPTAESFPATFRSAPVVDYERFAPGDGVDVIVWERDNLGLFSPSSSPGLVGGGGGAPVTSGGASGSSPSSGGASGSGGGSSGTVTSSGGASPAGITGGASGGGAGASDLGTFTIGQDGDIRLPYVGPIKIAGLTPAEARILLLKRLRGLVIATDLRLAPTGQHGSLLTIQGDVSRAGVYPIEQGVQRLSALLGQAGPDQTNPEQTSVTVRRGAVSATVRLIDIYRDPSQDIALQPGDSIVVSSIQEYITVIGAAGGQGRVKISKRNYSVLDAVADSRGLADAVADPRAVFVLCPHPDTDPITADARPTVYQFDMRQPDNVFLASRFAVRDGYVVFISDAPFTQVQKALSAFSATLGTARSVSGLTQ